MKFILFLFFLTYFSVFANDPEIDSAIKKLDNKVDKDVISACKIVGAKKKSELALPKLFAVLKSNKNPRVLISIIEAIGYIGKPGESTKQLRDQVINQTNPDIIYAALTSLVNITIINKNLEPEAKQALDFANKNHRKDEFVIDLLDRVNQKLKLMD